MLEGKALVVAIMMLTAAPLVVTDDGRAIVGDVTSDVTDMFTVEEAAEDPKLDEVLDDEMGVIGVKIKNTLTNKISEIECKGYFSAIGHKPNTDIFLKYLETDDVGYLIADGVKTSIPGVYAAGDVADKIYRQAVTAAGTGCAAALEAERFIENN